MTWLIGIGALIVLGALLAIALGFAGRPVDDGGEAAALAELAERKSPSGQPFFPDGDSVLDFAQTVEEARSDPDAPDRAPESQRPGDDSPAQRGA